MQVCEPGAGLGVAGPQVERLKMEFEMLHNLGDLLWDAIEKYPTRELKKLVSECQGATTTNCWWLSYKLEKIVAQIARSIMAKRVRKEGTEVRPMR